MSFSAISIFFFPSQWDKFKWNVFLNTSKNFLLVLSHFESIVYHQHLFLLVIHSVMVKVIGGKIKKNPSTTTHKKSIPEKKTNVFFIALISSYAFECLSFAALTQWRLMIYIHYCPSSTSVCLPPLFFFASTKPLYKS